MEIYIDFVQGYREILNFHQNNYRPILVIFAPSKLNGVWYLCIDNMNNHIKLLTDDLL